MKRYPRKSVPLSSKATQLVLYGVPMVLFLSVSFFVFLSPVIVPLMSMRFMFERVSAGGVQFYVILDQKFTGAMNAVVKGLDDFRQYSQPFTRVWNHGAKGLRNIWKELQTKGMKAPEIVALIQRMETLRPRAVDLFVKVVDKFKDWGMDIVRILDIAGDTLFNFEKIKVITAFQSLVSITEMVQPHIDDLAALARKLSKTFFAAYKTFTSPIKRIVNTLGGSFRVKFKHPGHPVHGIGPVLLSELLSDPSNADNLHLATHEHEICHHSGMFCATGGSEGISGSAVFAAGTEALVPEVTSGIGIALAQLDKHIDTALLACAQTVRSLSENTGAVVNFVIGLFEKRPVAVFDLIMTIIETGPKTAASIGKAVIRMFTQDNGEFRKRIVAAFSQTYKKLPTGIGEQIWTAITGFVKTDAFDEMVSTTLLDPFRSGAWTEMVSKAATGFEDSYESLTLVTDAVFDTLAAGVSVTLSGASDQIAGMSQSAHYEHVKLYARHLEHAKLHSPHRIDTQHIKKGGALSKIGSFSRLLVTVLKKSAWARNMLFSTAQNVLVDDPASTSNLMGGGTEFFADLLPLFTNAITSLATSGETTKYGGRVAVHMSHSLSSPLYSASSEQEEPDTQNEDSRLDTLIASVTASSKIALPKLFDHIERALKKPATRTSLFNLVTEMFSNRDGSVGTLMSLITDFVTEYPKETARIVFSTWKQTAAALPKLGDAVVAFSNQVRAYDTTKFRSDFKGVFDDQKDVGTFLSSVFNAWGEFFIIVVPSGFRVFETMFEIVLDNAIKFAEKHVKTRANSWIHAAYLVSMTPFDNAPPHIPGAEGKEGAENTDFGADTNFERSESSDSPFNMLGRFLSMIITLAIDSIQLGFRVFIVMLRFVRLYINEIREIIMKLIEFVQVVIVGILKSLTQLAADNETSEIIAEFIDAIFALIVETLKSILKMFQLMGDKIIEMLLKLSAALIQLLFWIVVQIGWDKIILDWYSLIACVIFSVISAPLQPVPGVGDILKMITDEVCNLKYK